jgi:PAS domain S-box-containing protein
MTLCVVRDITERKRLERERQALLEIIQGVSTSANLDSLLQLIHQTIQKVLYAENCFVALYEENTGMLNMQFFVDQHDQVPAPQKVGRGRTGYVFRTGWPMLMTNEVFETLVEEGEIESIGTPPAAWLGVPLNSLSKTIGVLVVQHYEDDKAYSERDVEFLSSVGGQIAVAIERKRAEAALRGSEERYREIFEMDLTGSCISSADGKVLASNPAFARIFGFSSVEEALASPARSFYKTSDAREELIDLVRRERKIENRETELVRRDGSSIFVVQNLQGVFDEGGELLEMHSHFLDITERRQAEAERARLLSVLEASLNEIYVFDPNTLRFEYVNAGACRNLGYTLDALCKMTPLDLKPEFTEASFSKMISPLLHREKEKHVFCTVHRRADGSLYPVEVHLQLVELSDKPTFLAVILDITERKQAEEALRQSEAQLRQSQKLEAVGQLAGGIAHDFNNLLTAINGYSALALKRLDDASPLKSYIEEIRRAGDRAANLTRQLLAFSRKQILEPKVLDLNEVVGDMSKMLRRMIGEDVELATHLASELGRVKADPGQIEQIIMNLVVNARDAMPTGGKVTIETANVFLDDEYAREHLPTEPGPYVMLAISDTGMGMDAETQARIFEPFFTTKELGKGTGLGLSTVYGIVKQSGGFVWVYSEPGHGTTFKIYLPQVDAEKTTKGKPVDEAAQHGSETILVVEDEEVVRKVAREILEGAGYDVLVADKSEEAIRLCIEHPQEIHLLLSDVVMPGASGREVADRLVSLRPEMKVLFMSGYTDEAIVHHGVLDPGVKFIQKPFSLAALCKRVREVLDAN